MKKIIQLKKLLDFVIVFSTIVFAILIVSYIYAIATNNYSIIKFTIQGKKIEHFDIYAIFYFVSQLIGYSFFIYAIIKLKKLVKLFVENQFFSKESIITLKKIGVFLLTSTLILNVSIFLFNIFTTSIHEFGFSTITPDSFVYSIIISLFFIILSYIFNEAKVLKEENELTI